MSYSDFKLTTPLIVLLTIASGLAIGNLYWAQPLLVQISDSLQTDVAQSGLLITATQVGYALGILFIVPLGDICPRRKLIAITMGLASLALATCALAPHFTFLAFALSALGITTVSGQIIIPMARDLADPSEQGHVVGIITAGITIGILIARSVSGLVADFLGWRAIYFIAALMNLVLMVVLWRSLPKLASKEKVSYPRLIGHVFLAVAQYKPLKWLMLVTGIIFGIVFNLFWNALTYLLSAPPFSFTPLQIGLVGVVGIAGSIASLWVGKFQDRGLGIPATGISIVVCLIGMLVALGAGESLLLVIVAAAIFSVGIQGVSILNQTRALALDPQRSSRLNTIFVFNNFVFAALGSAASGFIWAWAGWLGVCLAAIIATIVSFVLWFFTRKVLE